VYTIFMYPNEVAYLEERDELLAMQEDLELEVCWFNPEDLEACWADAKAHMELTESYLVCVDTKFNVVREYHRKD